MSIFVNKKTRVIVQGITGREGSFHAQQMQAYGTAVVGGVTPGKGGTEVLGIPVFDNVEMAVRKTGANTSVIYVPPAFAVDAIYEAVDGGIELIVCITEGIPANDLMKAYPYIRSAGARLIGPNCPGLISPGESKVGIMPGTIVKKGNVGVVSRSGTLTYEAIWSLTLAGLGQSTCVGIGGDQVIGTNFIDCLDAFEKDPLTSAVVMIGEIGGSDEEDAAKFIGHRMTKPVVAFIAGQTAPPGKRMGHAGAIILGSSGTAADKIAALKEADVPVAGSPTELPRLVIEALENHSNRSSGTAQRRSLSVWNTASDEPSCPSDKSASPLECKTTASRTVTAENAGALSASAFSKEDTSASTVIECPMLSLYRKEGVQ